MFSGGKLNRVNCWRLLNIIDDIGDIFIEMNKDISSDEEICLVTNKYKYKNNLK